MSLATSIFVDLERETYFVAPSARSGPNMIRKYLSYENAVALLRKPDRKLTVTHLKSGPEYYVAPGGPVTLTTS
jgi:hypothetical protein